jgi:hypothetical protein
MLCRDCARGKPSHLYQVDPKSFAIAIPVTLIAALFGGWLMATIRGIGFFGLFAGFLYGMAVGEIALRLTGRKRGLPIELLAGVSVLVGLLGGHAIQFLIETSSLSAHTYVDAEPMTAAALAIGYFMNPWMYVSAGVAIFGAVSRIRNIG